MLDRWRPMTEVGLDVDDGEGSVRKEFRRIPGTVVVVVVVGETLREEK